MIVVGAGNAGLSAAAATSKGGLKTLLLEKNMLPGGCATGFRRGRFEFEASLHELANVGTKEQSGSIRRMFDSLGADISWCTEKNAFRVIADGSDGYDVAVPSGVEAFCDEMERQEMCIRDRCGRIYMFLGTRTNIRFAFLGLQPYVI